MPGRNHRTARCCMSCRWCAFHRWYRFCTLGAPPYPVRANPPAETDAEEREREAWSLGRYTEVWEVCDDWEVKDDQA